MIYKGYKIRVRCIDWEQEQFLGEFWDFVSPFIGEQNIIGLGMNWTDDYLYFDYALGVIDNPQILNKIKNIDFSNTKFIGEYIEIELPDLDNWTTFKGKTTELRKIYDIDIASLNKEYDYELEYFYQDGNCEIKIHFIDG